MAQLLENLVTVTHIRQLTMAKRQFEKVPCPLLVSGVPNYAWHTYVHTDTHTYPHQKINL